MAKSLVIAIATVLILTGCGAVKDKLVDDPGAPNNPPVQYSLSWESIKTVSYNYPSGSSVTAMSTLGVGTAMAGYPSRPTLPTRFFRNVLVTVWKNVGSNRTIADAAWTVEDATIGTIEKQGDKRAWFSPKKTGQTTIIASIQGETISLPLRVYAGFFLGGGVDRGYNFASGFNTKPEQADVYMDNTGKLYAPYGAASLNAQHLTEVTTVPTEFPLMQLSGAGVYALRLQDGRIVLLQMDAVTNDEYRGNIATGWWAWPYT